MPKQNTKPADYPQAVIQQIELLAQNIVMARKRRNETQAQWAKKLGVSQPTMARIERGDPAVAMASYVMCMWLVNQAAGLANLIAPQNDHASLEREVTKVRSRGLAVTSVSSTKPGGSPTAKFATQLADNPSQKLAAQFKEINAAQLAAQLGINPAATNHEKTVAGLAALLSKAKPKSK